MKTYHHHARANWCFQLLHAAWLYKAKQLCHTPFRHLNLMYVSPRLPDNDSEEMELQWHWEGDWVLHQMTKVFHPKKPKTSAVH